MQVSCGGGGMQSYCALHLPWTQLVLTLQFPSRPKYELKNPEWNKNLRWRTRWFEISARLSVGTNWRCLNIAICTLSNHEYCKDWDRLSQGQILQTYLWNPIIIRNIFLLRWTLTNFNYQAPSIHCWCKQSGYWSPPHSCTWRMILALYTNHLVNWEDLIEDPIWRFKEKSC